MKIRNGFVSNSSSSSFVILLTKEQNEELLKNVDDYQRAILVELAEEKKAFGQDLILYAGSEGNYSIFEDWCVEEFEDMDDEEFEEKFGYEKYAGEGFYNIKWPEDVLNISVDM